MIKLGPSESRGGVKCVIVLSRCVGTVDKRVSKTRVRKNVRVRISPSAHINEEGSPD